MNFDVYSSLAFSAKIIFSIVAVVMVLLVPKCAMLGEDRGKVSYIAIGIGVGLRVIFLLFTYIVNVQGADNCKIVMGLLIAFIAIPAIYLAYDNISFKMLCVSALAIWMTSEIIAYGAFWVITVVLTAASGVL